MDERESVYIGGQWRPSSGLDYLKVENPWSQETIGSVPSGTAEDVDAAVAAANAAQDSWGRTSPAARAEILGRIADALAEHQEELARLISSEMGAPIRIARSIQTGVPIRVARSVADYVTEFAFERQVRNSRVFLEPAGVVGAITPWNYPLHQTIAKLLPALAAGCTVILKPSEIAPLVSYRLVDLLDELGLPPGVVNLVPGKGPIVGEAMASHQAIDMISFTGSTQAGKRVAELASRTVKKVGLELGGKSANVILPDADFEKAVAAGVAGCFVNSGQTCTAWTRMLVHESQYDDALALAVTRAAKFVAGDPHSSDTTLGPLVSQAQQQRVWDYIRLGEQEGAVVETGGTDLVDGVDTGYFVRPTVFRNVDQHMRIAQEEIFGPVLCVLPYRDEDDAIRIANDSVYGLSGSVWSTDPERAVSVARRIRTGKVDINGASYNPMAPFGGYKQSGLGRELGQWGIEEFCEIKSVQLLRADESDETT